MIEINPILAGTFDSPAYVPAASNINAAAVPDTSGTTGTAATDDRRYTKFDHSEAKVADADFSFSDLLDLINPLEHIPVLSSIYREVTGETINPVSRVAGDVLYGGIFGVASAIIGGVGAVADAALEQETGKDAVGTMVAALFGDDDKSGDAQVQVAAADTTVDPAVDAAPAPAAVPVAAVATVASAPTSTPTVNPGAIPATAPPLVPPPIPSAAQIAAATAPAAASGIPLGTGAKSFAINPANYVRNAPAPSMQDQNMAMAVAQATHGLRLGNTIYTSPLLKGVDQTAQRPTTQAAAPAAPVARATAATVAQPPLPPGDVAALLSSLGLNKSSALSDTVKATENMSAGGPASPLPQQLMDNMAMLKGISQYRNSANLGASTGAQVDVTN